MPPPTRRSSRGRRTSRIAPTASAAPSGWGNAARRAGPARTGCHCRRCRGSPSPSCCLVRSARRARIADARPAPRARTVPLTTFGSVSTKKHLAAPRSSKSHRRGGCSRAASDHNAEPTSLPAWPTWRKGSPWRTGVGSNARARNSAAQCRRRAERLCDLNHTQCPAPLVFLIGMLVPRANSCPYQPLLSV